MKNWNVHAMCPHCSSRMSKSNYETWYCIQCSWHFDYDDARMAGGPTGPIGTPGSVGPTGSHIVVVSNGSVSSADSNDQAPQQKKEIDYFAINRMFR